MVHNPIYDGPVYESVHSHFDTLESQVSAATNRSTTNNDHGLELVFSLKDNKNHYITQAGCAQIGFSSGNHDPNSQLLQLENKSPGSTAEDKGDGMQLSKFKSIIH